MVSDGPEISSVPQGTSSTIPIATTSTSTLSRFHKQEIKRWGICWSGYQKNRHDRPRLGDVQYFIKLHCATGGYLQRSNLV